MSWLVHRAEQRQIQNQIYPGLASASTIVSRRKDPLMNAGVGRSLADLEGTFDRRSLAQLLGGGERGERG